MKHDRNYFNLTQFEGRIQSLINILGNMKKLNVFLLPLLF